MAQGRYAEAAIADQRVLHENPNSIDALAQLGICLTNSGRVEEGIPFVRTSIVARTPVLATATVAMLLGSQPPISFANLGATGASDDITLATGSLVSASLALNPATGTRTGRFTETLAAAAGEGGFFTTSLGNHGLLDAVLTTPAAAFTATPGPNGSSIQMINGSASTFDLQVPEPASVTLLCAALVGLGLLRKRTRAP